MSSTTRIFLKNKNLSVGACADIVGDDAKHITKVMRLCVGDGVSVCDCAGGEYDAVITAIRGDSVAVTLGEYSKSDTEPEYPITVYQCLPKGDKLETIVQKAVELGATEIVPVLSERCISRPDAKAAEKKRERLLKISEGAASQCGRAVIPDVRSVISYSQALSELKEANGFICYEGDGTTHITEYLKGAQPERVAFLIGPEGGISDTEAESAKNMRIPLVGLGKRILRTETAALFVLSALSVLTD